MQRLVAHVYEVSQYRELVRNLVARDLKVRYRNSALGFLWCLLNPLLMMAVFTVVFTVLMRSDIEKFPVFILVGILAWNLNATALSAGINSIVENSALVMKVYFPRELLPIAAVLSNAVNFLLALIVLFPMIAIFGIHLGPSIVLLPLVLLTQILFTGGLALFLSALTVFFRDVGIIMETVILAWFFMTPIFYRLEDLFPQYARLMYIANPMASIISAYRDILYHGGWPAADFATRTLLTSVIVFVAGYAFFVRLSGRFGEEL